MGLDELCITAKQAGLDCIAVTDHNTMLIDDVAHKAESQHDIILIQGMEWTTFYGHMATLGIRDYVDWRTTSMVHIDKQIKKVHEQGGVAGIAHPYCVGTPLCTGCHWQYKIKDWRLVDYIEVWSGVLPADKDRNIKAYAMWTDLLNQGYRIAAMSGRDWHRNDHREKPVTATYVQVDDKENDIHDAIVQAVRNGRICVTTGPMIDFVAQDGDAKETYGVGDTMPCASGKLEGTAHVHLTPRSHGATSPSYRVSIMSNQGSLGECITEGHDVSISLKAEGVSWMRAEVFGTLCGEDDTLLAFTNAIYME